MEKSNPFEKSSEKISVSVPATKAVVEIATKAEKTRLSMDIAANSRE